ncbi:MAG: NUDIX hydrolase [Candidatus Zhuqueibacterota bacterium]
MTRTYPTAPLIGVGVVLFNENKQVLLVKRGHEPSKNLWSVPGGLVELGERVSEAARREVLEECNLRVEPRDVLAVVDLILRDESDSVKYHYVIIDYLADYVDGELQPQSDVSDAGWFSESDICNLDIPEITLDLLKKAFQLHHQKPGV